MQTLLNTRQSRAFSLIEVMAASAIFAAGLAAIFTAFGTSAQLFEHQRHTTQSIHLTEGKMEELLLRTAADVELIPSGTAFGPEWFDDKGFPAASGCPATTTGTPPETPACRYRVTWSAAAGGVVGVRVVTVTTSWSERGNLKSISFSSQRN